MTGRTDKAFDFFLSNGGLGIYNTIRRGPQAGNHQGPAIILPKALRILVRICSQVPAKIQSALLHAFGVQSGEGRGSPKTNLDSKKGGPPQFSTWMFVSSFLAFVWSHYFW